ncbi:MAG: hypothetical protein IH988_08260 [Planctomycetes bacterium]|nr:hypothetical protein [Planctomycetota bacterium]
MAPTSSFICSTCLPASSVLRFNVPLAFGQTTHFLAGNFSVSTGVLDVDVSFKTAGRLTHSGGRIDVDTSASCTFDD